MNNNSLRPKLSDILNGNAETLRSAWNATQAATDFAPLPAGDYDCRILAGELRKARTGTPEYSITFEVVKGEYIARRVWHSLFITPAALPMLKRDVAKFGITSLDQLDRPIPKGILATVRVSLRKGDDGIERNKVVKFDVTGSEPPDPFSPVAVTRLTPIPTMPSAHATFETMPSFKSLPRSAVVEGK